MTADDIHRLYEMPFFDLLHQARDEHIKFNSPHEIECCALFSIKTGKCPEDCAYCPQSAHYKTGLESQKLFNLEEVIAEAQLAKASGATRFCMGAAWRSPPKKDWANVLAMIVAVKNLGLETCATFGMLNAEEARELQQVGLDYYNHNLDTSPDFYQKIITTRTYQERLDTLENVHQAGVAVCCGGILSLGESREDRVQFLLALTTLSAPPKSIPLNHLIPIVGTPLEHTPKIDSFEFIRTIAITRLMFPQSKIRLSAGRESMNDEMQAWCFFAGANSIFLGDKLLTANNPTVSKDKELFNQLGLMIKRLD